MNFEKSTKHGLWFMEFTNAVMSTEVLSYAAVEDVIV